MNGRSETGVSGYIIADHVGRPQLRLDEPGQRLAHRHRVRAPHVIVVEEEREDPHVVARGLELFVVAIANLLRRRTARLRVAVDLDQLELLDRLRLAVLEDLEVGLRQVGDRLVLPVGDDDVDADEVDAAAERRLLRRRPAERRPGPLARVAALEPAAAAAPGC